MMMIQNTTRSKSACTQIIAREFSVTFYAICDGFDSEDKIFYKNKKNALLFHRFNYMLKNFFALSKIII